MLKSGDGFVYLFIAVLLVIWIWRPWKAKRLSASNVPTTGKMVELLEREGYDIVSWKVKIPLAIAVENRETETNIAADYLVRRGGRTYIVKVERDESESITPKRVRERYLIDCLAFRAAGVVIASPEKNDLHHVDISIRPFSTTSHWRWIVISFFLGAGITFFWLY